MFFTCLNVITVAPYSNWAKQDITELDVDIDACN